VSHWGFGIGAEDRWYLSLDTAQFPRKLGLSSGWTSVLFKEKKLCIAVQFLDVCEMFFEIDVKILPCIILL